MKPTDLPFATRPADPAPPSGSDAELVTRLYHAALVDSPAHALLRELTTRFPGRLSGSAALEGAVIWMRDQLAAAGADRTELQPVTVPHWTRGAARTVLLPRPGDAPVPLAACALGGAGSTPPAGLRAPVVVVHSLAELAQTDVRGRLVLFNRPLDPGRIDPLRAYEEASDQRNFGPAAAARHGALAALTRSLTQATDDIAHAGTTFFPPELAPIPAAALSPHAADLVAAAARSPAGAEIELHLETAWHPDALSHNVIGEIRGTEFPEKIILVGGHLDCWDNTPGAHDDGAGCIHALDVLRLIRALGHRQRHTLRAVIFTNEENGVRGGLAYAARAVERGEEHLLALESDFGGFAPHGFELGNAAGDAHLRAARWRDLLAPFGLHVFTPGYGGIDVEPLLRAGFPVAGLVNGSQRYFDLHHTPADTIDTVHPRELALGSAALAALALLVDRHGL